MLNISACITVLKEALFSRLLYGGDNLDKHQIDGFKTLT